MKNFDCVKITALLFWLVEIDRMQRVHRRGRWKDLEEKGPSAKKKRSRLCGDAFTVCSLISIVSSSSSSSRKDALSKEALITAVAYLPDTKWQADKLT